MVKVSSCKDLLMLLLYAKGHTGKQCEPIRGRTRVMKMVFLFDKEVRPKFNLRRAFPDGTLPDFAPYDFGPFSAQVFADLEFLVGLGFVELTPVPGAEVSPDEALEYSYWQAGATPLDQAEGPEHEEEFSLSSDGREFVKQGEAGKLTPEQWSVLSKFKARCTEAPLRALLRYVYAKYPQMATQSKIRDEILSKYRH